MLKVVRKPSTNYKGLLQREAFTVTVTIIPVLLLKALRIILSQTFTSKSYGTQDSTMV